MKEIKFRAWHRTEKKYYEVGGIDFKGSHIWVSFQDDEGFYYDVRLEFDDIILEQYTGLKDRNDVEIYEGDVVEAYLSENDECPTIKGKIDRITGYIISDLGDEAFYSLIDMEKLKIIGNIHEITIKED